MGDYRIFIVCDRGNIELIEACDLKKTLSSS